MTRRPAARDTLYLNPETRVLKEADNELLLQGLEELPTEFREVVVLRYCCSLGKLGTTTQLQNRGAVATESSRAITNH